MTHVSGHTLYVYNYTETVFCDSAKYMSRNVIFISFKLFSYNVFAKPLLIQLLTFGIGGHFMVPVLDFTVIVI